VPGFPEEYEYRDMAGMARKISCELREGPVQCDLILAITHCRLPNDVALANTLGAVADTNPNEHGVDMVLGGHDHMYYIGRGVQSYEGEPFEKDMIGAEDDQQTYIIKSGSDFHDLSEVEITLSDPHPAPAVRRRTIESVHVKHHQPTPDAPTQPELKVKLDELMSHISKSTGQPVAITLNEWDASSKSLRTDESALGDFVADILLVSMEHSLRSCTDGNEVTVSRGHRVADCCLICGGSLRSDSIFGPGEITLGNLLELMPFEDPVVVKELTGQTIWDALENGLSSYPKQEGRFPQVAGMRVVWDSRRPPGKRVISVHILHQPYDGQVDESSNELKMKMRRFYKFAPDDEDDEGSVMVYRSSPRVREALQMDKTYRVVTRGYLASGNDGYDMLKQGKFIVDGENGQLMSTIVRKFLLGATYIWRWNQLYGQSEDVKNLPLNSSEAETSSLSLRHEQLLVPNQRKFSSRHPMHLSSFTNEAVKRAYNLSLRRSQSFSLESRPTLPETPRRSSSSMLNTPKPSPLFVDYSPHAIRNALYVASHEHHSHFDVASRIETQGLVNNSQDEEKSKLAVVMAIADGRLVDQARIKSDPRSS